MHVLDALVRHQQPVLVFKVAGSASHPFDHVLLQPEVIRMYPTADSLERHWQMLFKFKNAMSR
jgi:hypothetical protein